MKIEALNCPNCGAAVSSDKTQCQFCNSRLKTMACPSCFGLLFLGSKHCSHCGNKAVQPKIDEQKLGDCPRCKIALTTLQIESTILRECKKCGGLWTDVETFENICAIQENQAAVLTFLGNKSEIKNTVNISYVPCPDCQQLMNRNNFARSSGIIIDLCKRHGVWFDAEELPKIIEFIKKGGLDLARQKEKLQIKDEIDRLKEIQRTTARQQSRYESKHAYKANQTFDIKEFIHQLFD